jgi:hypothetical protein
MSKWDKNFIFTFSDMENLLKVFKCIPCREQWLLAIIVARQGNFDGLWGNYWLCTINNNGVATLCYILYRESQLSLKIKQLIRKVQIFHPKRWYRDDTSRTLCPCMFNPRTIRPRRLYPGVFTSLYVSSRRFTSLYVSFLKCGTIFRVRLGYAKCPTNSWVGGVCCDWPYPGSG